MRFLGYLLTVAMWAASEAKEINSPLVRVLIHSSRDSVQISGRNLQVIPEAGGWSSVKSDHVDIRLSDQGLKVCMSRVCRESLSVVHIVGERLSGGKNQVWPPVLRVLIYDNEILVVSVLRLEEYLKGVIFSEMPASWPKESLKAQMILARSYVFTKLQERFAKPFDVYASELDQVYRWPDRKTRRLAAPLVQETLGRVIVNQRGQVIPTYYHADCGGELADPAEIWGRDKPSSGRRRCLHAYHRWSAQVRVQELRSRLGWSAAERVSRIETVSAGERVHRVVFYSQQGKKTQLTGEELRKRLGYRHVRSTRFTLQEKNETVHLQGLGFGHGAGACQKGMRQKALSNMNHLEILGFYYPDHQIVDLYPMTPASTRRAKNSMTPNVTNPI